MEYIRDVYADLVAMGEGARRPGDRSDISSDDEDEMEVLKNTLQDERYFPPTDSRLAHRLHVMGTKGAGIPTAYMYAHAAADAVIVQSSTRVGKRGHHMLEDEMDIFLNISPKQIATSRTVTQPSRLLLS